MGLEKNKQPNEYSEKSIKRVEWVYRIDSRSPDVVFQSGFTPWGTNDYLLYHLTGQSVTAPSAPPELLRTSNFVGTTHLLSEGRERVVSNLMFDLTGGVERGTGSRVDRLWIYQIQADLNFYNAVASVTEAIDSEQYEGDSLRLMEDYLAYFSRHREFSARGGIPPQRIIGAEEWQRVDAPNMPSGFIWQLVPDSGITNAFYQPLIDPGSNPEPYTRMINNNFRFMRRLIAAVSFPQLRNPAPPICDLMTPLSFCLSSQRRESQYSQDSIEEPALILEKEAIIYIFSGLP